MPTSQVNACYHITDYVHYANFFNVTIHKSFQLCNILILPEISFTIILQFQN